MKKHVSIAMTFVLLFCMITLPNQALAADETATSIQSGETVYGSPTSKDPEEYFATVSGKGEMVVNLDTDGNAIIKVTNSEGKEVAPIEYSEKTGDEYSSYVYKGLDGYCLAKHGTKDWGGGVFVYPVKEGNYSIIIHEQLPRTTSAIKMNVTFPSVPPTVAKPTASSVLINEKITAFDAYTINGNNYFKLRDLAQALNGTDKQFEVTWDGAKRAINLASDKPYTTVGGEMAKGDGATKAAQENASAIYLDGQPITLTAYTINGNNYFKLRDIGKTFDFDVSWDSINNTIFVDTAKTYTDD